MTGVFATDAPASDPRPQPVERPPSWGEQLGAGWRTALDDDEAANLNNRIQAYNAVEDSLVALGHARSRYNNPEWRSFLTTVETSPQRLDAIWSDVEAERARDPSHFKDIPKTRAEFDRWAYARQGGRAADMRTLSVGGSASARILPGLGFGISQLAQPENLPYLAIGGSSRTLPGLMAREFLANSYGQVANNPRIAQSRENMGEPYEDAISDVLMAGAGGSIFAGTLHVGIPLAGKAFDAAADAIAPGYRAGKALEAAPLAGATDGDVVRKFGEAVPAEIRTPDERAAAHVITRQAEIDAANPFEAGTAGMDAHAARLQGAMEQILAAQPGRAAPAPAGAAPGLEAVKAMIRRGESGGDPNARNAQPGQTASGLYGFTDPTFIGLYKQVFGPAKKAEILARKNDPDVQDRLMDAALEGYQGALAHAGMPETPGNLYLMHFLGPEKAIDVLHARPDTPIGEILSKSWIKVNRELLEGKTAGDVVAEMDRRAGGAGAIADAGEAPLRLAAESDAAAVATRPEIDQPELALEAAPAPRVRDDVIARSYALPMRDVGDGAAPIVPRTAATLGQAKDAAAEFVGIPIRNAETGLEATVSRGTLAKMTSGSATLKSTSAIDHAMAVANADRLFALASLAERGPDARGEPTIEAISRYHAPMETPSGPVTVRMTVKETKSAKTPNPLYTIETIKVDRDGGSDGSGGPVEPGPEAPPEGGIERAPGQDRNAPRPGSETDIGAPPQNVDAGARADLEPADHQAPSPVEIRQLELFSDPAGEGPKVVADSLAHDARAALEAGAGGTFRLAEGDERPLAKILEEIDADEAAIAAARNCL